MLIDSDKRNQQTPLNPTKKRIIDEFASMNAHCWITSGKEIENYIPESVVDDFWNVDNSGQVDRYGSFFEYLDNITPGEGRKYNAKKPLLAEKLAPYMTMANLVDVLDMNENMSAVCDAIRSWNS